MNIKVLDYFWFRLNFVYIVYFNGVRKVIINNKLNNLPCMMGILSVKSFLKKIIWEVKINNKRFVISFKYDESDKKILVGYVVKEYIWVLERIFVIGHTQPKAPDPIRTPKLSGWRRG